MRLNKEYKEISHNILEDENFLALKNDTHHGSNRYEHCKRVAYLSYLMAKVFKANTEDVVVSGLLHDFFYGKTNTVEEISYLNHPYTSAMNAKKCFNISDKEMSIIMTHMYHYALVKDKLPFINKDDKVNSSDYKPQSREGYIVCVSDLLVSIFEGSFFKLRYNVCLYLIFLINIVRY